MSNAMKKLKLLHNLTAAASSNALPSPPCSAPSQVQNTSSQQQNTQFCTPPATPQLSHVRHSFQFTSPQYTETLRNARSALLSLQHHPAYNQPHRPPPIPPQSSSTATPQHQLPAGFLALTPSTNDPIPGLSVPDTTMLDPQPTTHLHHHHHHHIASPALYTTRPPLSNSHTTRRTLAPPRPPRQPHPLTAANLARVAKDSRQAKWERVNAYVRDQRTSVLPYLPASSLIPDAPQRAHTPAPLISRKRRAEELAAIDAKAHLLDEQDLVEQAARSLWSGGSGGTNGVDEFVWSEDEEEEPVTPPPRKEGGFGGEARYTGGYAGETGKGGYEGEGYGEGYGEGQDGVWGDMPRLCREGELEGGLARLVGRRVSAIY